MIFFHNDGLIVLMLAEQDVNNMRSGRTTFVDDRQLKGKTFNKIVLSLHKTNEQALELIKKAGHNIDNPITPMPTKTEAICKGCNGIMAVESLYKELCIICWSEEAKHYKELCNTKKD
jgi:hypothetical protein